MQDDVFTLESWGPKEIFVAAIVVFVTILLLSWTSRFLHARRHGSRRLPPGPKGWPLVGAIPYMGEFPHKSLFELSKEYGPVMYMHLGARSVLVISNGEMAKEVFQNNDQNFASRPVLLISSYLTYGRQDLVWTQFGPFWREIRKTVNLKLLTSARLAIFTKIVKGEIVSAIQAALQQSQSGEEKVNLSSILNGMSMNIMTMMMWNKRQRNTEGNQSANDKKFETLLRDIEHIIGANNIADFLPSFLQSFAMRLSGLDKKTKQLYEEMNSFWEEVICEKEQALALANGTKVATDADDFVDVLLRLMNQPAEGSQPLSREAVKGTLVDMIVAGTDTTSVTLNWIFTQLLKRPDIMKKVQDELTTVVGADRLVNESDIPNLKYLHTVVREGLRMYSAAPLGIPHLSHVDCKVGGYDIPANTTVFINIYAIHHDEAVWENPWKFNPDRFLDSRRSYKGQNYDFIPFSSGRRICSGLHLAETVLHIGIAQFLHAVRWSLPNGQAPGDIDMTEASGITNPRATPLVVKVKPRLAHHILYPTIA